MSDRPPSAASDAAARSGMPPDPGHPAGRTHAAMPRTGTLGGAVGAPVDATDGVGGLRLRRVQDGRLAEIVVAPPGPAVAGRSHDCEIVLDDPAISRRHVRFDLGPGGWLVTDLGSRHGTRLGSTRLDPETPVPIGPGDRLIVGPVVMHVAGGTNLPPDAAGARGGLGGTTDAFATIGAPGFGASATVVDEALPPELDLRAVDPSTLASPSARRLEHLMAAASSITATDAEADLARIVADLALHGTELGRSAVVSVDDGRILAAAERSGATIAPVDPSRVRISSTLVARAVERGLVRLAGTAPLDVGRSVQMLDLHDAIAAPVVIDDQASWVVILDARGGEPGGAGDDPAFVRAAAELAALGLAQLSRRRIEERRRRLEQDLQAARAAQEHLGPPAAGTLGAVRHAVTQEPGRIVAGDLFDIFEVPGDRVAFALGDVTGHGVPAGIIMASLVALIRAAFSAEPDVAAAMAIVDRHLAERTPIGLFASVVAGVVEPDGTVQLVDAGHGWWTIVRAGSPPTIENAPGPRGVVLGVAPEMPYEAGMHRLGPGDRIVLASDGIVERTVRAEHGGGMFGMERFLQAMQHATHDDPAEDVRSLLAAAEAIAAGPAGDDVTVASVQYRPVG